MFTIIIYFLHEIGLLDNFREFSKLRHIRKIKVNFFYYQKNGSSFEELLNTISSTTIYNILKLYSKGDFNLTDTAKNLDISISTVQDNLKKLIKTDLIYSNDKTYHLSSFGCIILQELEKLKNLIELNEFLGRIPAELIPPKYLNLLVKDLSNMQYGTNSLQFMNYMNELMDDVKKSFNTKQISDFKVLGWWNLQMDLDFFKIFFKDFSLDNDSFKEILSHFSFQLVSYPIIFDDIKKMEDIKELMEHFHMYDFFRTCTKLENCNFTIMKYKKIVILVLIDHDDFDFHNFLIFENNDNALEFFNSLFQFYWERSDRLMMD